jgi:hypothetical protein
MIMMSFFWWQGINIMIIMSTLGVGRGAVAYIGLLGMVGLSFRTAVKLLKQ